jgi:adenylate cyclase
MQAISGRRTVDHRNAHGQNAMQVSEASGGSPHQVILFADIVGSTALYEAIGDELARELTGACLDLMKTVARERRGRVAAELGDEIMCFFDDPADAAAAACDMHARIEGAFPGDERYPALKLRIGMHCGAVAGNRDDLVGETAKIAHWAARNAKAEQSLATMPVIEALPRIYRAVSRYVDDETWNFVSFEHVALYEIIWDVDSITVASASQTRPEEHRYERVSFSSGNHTVVVNVDRPVISVGRGAQNDLVLNNELVSRLHFTAQFSRGRCSITDKSTNGTFVTPATSGRQSIRHETSILIGQGIIELGSAKRQGDFATLHYVCS